MYTVYKHTCPNGKCYIGITAQKPIKRWKKGNGYLGNEYFYRAIEKYGWENIKHEILFTDLTKEQATQKEIELIAEYKSNTREFGYNISSGGESPAQGIVFTDEARAKLSACHNGKKFTEEHKKKISAALKGRAMNEEWRKKISDAKKGKNKGLLIGEKHPMSKKVIQYDLCGNIVNIYGSTREAERETGVSRRSIARYCNQQTSAINGYVWRYANVV